MDSKAGEFGVVAPEVLLSHSGLDFLQGVNDGTIPAPPIAGTLAFQLVAVEKGRAVFEGVPQHRHHDVHDLPGERLNP
jgi:hypothetical protein